MTDSINNTRFSYLTLPQQQRNNNTNNVQAKMMSYFQEAFGSGDIGKMLAAMVKMQIAQTMGSNPMTANYVPQLFGLETPAAADKVDFSSIEKRDAIMNTNAGYLDSMGEIKDVALNTSEQNSSIQNGLFKAPKESISVMIDNKDKSNELQKYIQDNKIDFNAMEKRLSEIQSNKGYAALNAETMTAKATKDVALNDTNAASFGITTENGKMNSSQIDTLKRQGILDENNKFTADAEKKMEEQKKLSTEASLLGKATTAYETDPAKQKAKIYTQTEDKKSQLADIDKEGNIKGLAETNSSIATDKLAKAEKHLTGVTPDAEKVLAKKDVTTIDKNGNITINLDGLSADEVAKINKLKYTGTGKLTIKNKDNNALELELGKNTTQVDLQGGNYKISTQNTALQIKSDAESTIKSIQGKDLEHLVIKGGNVETDLSTDLAKLKAVKIENATLLNGLNASSDNDIAVELNGVKSEVNKAINIASKQDAQVKSNGSSLNNVNITAGKDQKSGLFNAIFEGDAKTKANDIKLSGQKTTVTTDGMQANSIDISGAATESGVFLGKGTKITNGIKINDALAKDKNEFVYENQKDAELKGIKINGKDGKETDNIAKREMETKDVFKYLGWSESRFKKVQENEQLNQNNQYQYGYPYGFAAPPNQKNSWLLRFLEGVTMGMGMQMNQQQQQQQNPWQPPYNWMNQGW